VTDAQIHELLANLRAEIAEQREADIKHMLTAASDVVVQVLSDYRVRETRDELFALVDKKFVELLERLDVFLPDRDPPASRRKVLDS
jgi:hypothetical protein